MRNVVASLPAFRANPARTKVRFLRFGEFGQTRRSGGRRRRKRTSSEAAARSSRMHMTATETWLRTTAKATKKDLAETARRAHETLVELNEENRPRFKRVIEYLKTLN